MEIGGKEMSDRIAKRNNIRKIGPIIFLVIILVVFNATPVAAEDRIHEDDSKVSVNDDGISSGYIYLQTDNSEVMRIVDDKIGIGDTGPDATLEIVESGTTPFMISNGVSGDGDFMIMDTSGSVGIGITTPTHRLTIESTDDDTLRLIGPDGAVGYGARLNFGDQDFVYIEEDVDDKLYIYGQDRIALMGGDVGIGTSSPGAKLDVHVSSGGAATIGSSSNSATGSFDIALGTGTTASGGGGSIAMGDSTTASGAWSTAMGHDSTASGGTSTAMGYDTTASGGGSVAMGHTSIAGGNTSVAMGFSAVANGNFSTSIGTYMTVSSTAEYSIGIGLDNGYDTITQSSTMAIMGGKVGIGALSPDKLLHIGESGQSSGEIRFEASDGDIVDLGITTSDAFYITGGNVGIGTTNPSTTLHVDGDVAFGAGSELTIIAGVVEVTHSYHTIDTESNIGTDNLDIISGGDVAGQILIIRAADNDRTVVVRDDSGNVQLYGTDNFEMDHGNDTLILIYDGTSEWLELSRSDND
jgi:hypothetical protein